MNYGLMLGGVILGGVIIGILVHLYHKREIAALKADKEANEAYYNQLWIDNETLRAYMDNQHVVYNPGLRESLNKPPANKELIVLIRADDLHEMAQRQWRDGYDMAAVETGKTMQMRYGIDNQVEEEGVARIRASFADKRFDNDFARLVNAVTSIGLNYGQTQQLRDRMSRQITDFRMYLSKKQRGEKAEFPKM